MPAMRAALPVARDRDAHRGELRARHLSRHVPGRVEPPARVAAVAAAAPGLAVAPRRRRDAIAGEPAEQRPVDLRPLRVAAEAVHRVDLVQVRLRGDVERREHVPGRVACGRNRHAVHPHGERDGDGSSVRRDRDRAAVGARRAFPRGRSRGRRAAGSASPSRARSRSTAGARRGRACGRTGRSARSRPRRRAARAPCSGPRPRRCLPPRPRSTRLPARPTRC